MTMGMVFKSASPFTVRRTSKPSTFGIFRSRNTATGDTGHFDMKSNTITLLGNVVVTKGKSVMRGERLVVNLDTGVSTVDAGKSNGPVRILIDQSDTKGASKDAKPETRSDTTRSSNSKDPVKLPALR